MAQNESWSEGLPPSQGGKYVGFGSSPAPAPRNTTSEGGVFSVVSQGFGRLSKVAASAANVVQVGTKEFNSKGQMLTLIEYLLLLYRVLLPAPVSNFGPVQDVRIPYQQKRMFGFVTFEYLETVKLILAKGNPHFVCDARVLFKPYKEKGKIPDKHRKQQQQMERGEFNGCGSPSGLEYDLLPREAL